MRKTSVGYTDCYMAVCQTKYCYIVHRLFGYWPEQVSATLLVIGLQVRTTSVGY